MNEFVRGIAFICEGQTERVFYYSMLEHYLSKHDDYKIIKELDKTTNEFQYILENDTQAILVKMFTVGTIIAHTQAPANWFKGSCKLQYKKMDWVVFLCYDTDTHNRDVSQFQEGDWKELKKTIMKNRRTSIIDLAAAADIEDVMLLDMDGVCSFLGIIYCPTPPGRKGKSIMKKIFRDNNSCYHEGERAKLLIDHLDKDAIISKSPIPFEEIEKVCFK